MIKLNDMLRSALMTGHNWIKAFKRQGKSLAGVLRYLILLEQLANARSKANKKREKNIMNKIGKYITHRQEKKFFKKSIF